MKIAIIIARVLLGATFVFFGANGILHFLPMKVPPGDAGTWATLMAQHHYMTFVSFIQLVGGLLVLVNRFVPFGLTLLAPVLVNILLFHFTFLPEGVILGIILSVLELFLIGVYWRSFASLFHPNPPITKVSV
jgi:putative oxidoreductase